MTAFTQRCLSLTLVLTSLLCPLMGSAEDASPSNQPAQDARLPIEELRVFAEAFDRISRAYVEEVDDKALLEKAIKGLLSELDPHSAFLDADSFNDLQETTTGNYGGLGIEIGRQDGVIKVVTPMDDTPASRAGILPGDLIIELDGQTVRSLGVNQAVDVMRGEPGSEVTLTVLREGESQPIEVTLVREVINVSSVRSRLLEPGFGYLRIAQFQADTGAEAGDAIAKMNDLTPLKGLVLDLRNNPGGVLQAAVAVSYLFLNQGTIVYTEGRLDPANMVYEATGRTLMPDLPLVVLINEGSASASEIVAGALQDHRRALLLGTATFGKGSVQTVLPLTNEKAIKLTTALYFTPNGRSIQAEGIQPDLRVERSTVTRVRSNPFAVQEKDLPGHLSAPEGTQSSEQSKPDLSAKAQDNLAGWNEDFQLTEALNLLKGLNILSAASAMPSTVTPRDQTDSE
ncbi:MAG: S41 family peptidase [Pseudomonadales bacterium]